MSTRRVLILGSTGSIGRNTLDVIDHLNALHAAGRSPDRFEVVGLAAGSRADVLGDQAKRFPDAAAVLAADAPEGPRRMAESLDCDLVVAAIVGVAGLGPTLAAVERGIDVALANKESLVVAGTLLMAAAARSGSVIRPVDSEHAAVAECLLGRDHAEIERVVLTASGGAFRDRDPGSLADATVDEALDHPTWDMGAKVTIDSATLMNKVLELIEAHHLFGLPGSRLDAVIHRSSMIHALVEFVDGGVVTQIAPPDMRMPIQRALAWPHCLPGLSPRLGLDAACELTLEPICADRYPAYALAHPTLAAGGTAGCVLNAANEAAVAGFLAGTYRFGDLVPLVSAAAAAFPAEPLRDLGHALDLDAEVRGWVAGRA